MAQLNEQAKLGMKGTTQNATSASTSQTVSLVSQSNDVLKALEKAEYRKQKLESEIEISTNEDYNSKKRTIVAKLDQKIVDLHESL